MWALLLMKRSLFQGEGSWTKTGRPAGTVTDEERIRTLGQILPPILPYVCQYNYFLRITGGLDSIFRHAKSFFKRECDELHAALAHGFD